MATWTISVRRRLHELLQRGIENHTEKPSTSSEETAGPQPEVESSGPGNSLGNFTPNQLAQFKKHAMIECIKRFPALWDSNDTSAKNLPYCNLLWENIARVLNTDVKLTKMRWKRLRTFYKKRYLARMRGGKTNRNTTTDALSFLENEIERELAREIPNPAEHSKPSAATPTENGNSSIEVIYCDSDDDEGNGDDDDDCQIIETRAVDQSTTGSTQAESATLAKTNLLNHAEKPDANHCSPVESKEKAVFLRPRKMEDLLKPVFNVNNTDRVKSGTSVVNNKSSDTTIQKEGTLSTELALSSHATIDCTNDIEIPPENLVVVSKPTIFVSNAFPLFANQPSQDVTEQTSTPPEKRIKLVVARKYTKPASKQKKFSREQGISVRKALESVINSISQPQEQHPKTTPVIDNDVRSSASQVSSSNQLQSETPSESPTSPVNDPVIKTVIPTVSSSQEATEKAGEGSSVNINNLSDSDDEASIGFLTSLLPDLESMSEQQFRTFKQYSTALVSMILDS